MLSQEPDFIKYWLSFQRLLVLKDWKTHSDGFTMETEIHKFACQSIMLTYDDKLISAAQEGVK